MDIMSRAQRWLEQDPDAETRRAAEVMLTAARGGEDDALQQLDEHFGARLQFGTAGMRGAMGPGPNRMNLAMVRWVTAGLGRYLQQTCLNPLADGVVVGFDGRHGSLEYAHDAARVLISQGFVVYLHDQVVPTPVLAHSLLHLSAAAGIMVTASHNPPQDNGYKVYWTNGAQIVPPHDRGISEAIDAISGPGAVAVGDVDLQEARRQGLLQDVPVSALADYQRQVLGLRVHHETGATAVYTAMHGVGWKTLDQVIRAAGHTPLRPVPSQRDPDGDFPTVSFPNPEEPGAMDLSMALAEETGADLVIANDPDADRLAVAVPDGTGWRKLTGNQIGVLLAEDLLAHGGGGEDRLVATTIVSSTLLRRLAEVHGVQYTETLTGFKWIANAAIDHDGPFVMGYEEALGYSVGPVVRDKDGISAALLFLDLASWCKARGTTVLAHLTALYRREGLYACAQRSVVLPGVAGAARISAVMDALRGSPPREISGVRVMRRQDVLTGEDVDCTTGRTSTVLLPSSNVLAYELEDGSRVLARPSGTEPKIKFYFEVREALGPEEPLTAAEARAGDRINQLADAFLAPVGMA